MRIINCEICGKKMDISNWVSNVEFNINGTNSLDDFNKEDIEMIKDYDVCRDCFYGLKSLFYLLSCKELTIDEIRKYRYNRNRKKLEKEKIKKA